MAESKLSVHINLELVWYNQYPTQQFGEQFITLDLSKYKAIQISFLEYSSVQSRGILSNIVAILNEPYSNVVICPYLYDNKVSGFSCRLFKPTSSNVFFQ